MAEKFNCVNTCNEPSSREICTCRQCDPYSCFSLRYNSTIQCTCLDCENEDTCLYYGQIKARKQNTQFQDDPKNYLYKFPNIKSEVIYKKHDCGRYVAEINSLPSLTEQPKSKQAWCQVDQPSNTNGTFIESVVDFLSSKLKNAVERCTWDSFKSSISNLSQPSTSNTPCQMRQTPQICRRVSNGSRNDYENFETNKITDNSCKNILNTYKKQGHGLLTAAERDTYNKSHVNPMYEPLIKKEPCIPVKKSITRGPKVKPNTNRDPSLVRQKLLHNPAVKEAVRNYLLKKIEDAKKSCKPEDRPSFVELHPKVIDLITKQILKKIQDTRSSDLDHNPTHNVVVTQTNCIGQSMNELCKEKKEVTEKLSKSDNVIQSLRKNENKNNEYIVQTCNVLTYSPKPIRTSYNCKDSKQSPFEVPEEYHNLGHSPINFYLKEFCDDSRDTKECLKNRKLVRNDNANMKNVFNEQSISHPKSVPSCNCKHHKEFSGKNKSMTKQNFIVARFGQQQTCQCSSCHCMDCLQPATGSNLGRVTDNRGPQTQDVGTTAYRHVNCYCENCNNRLCEQEGADTCSCDRHKDGLMRKPVTKDINEYDIRHATIYNKNGFKNENQQHEFTELHESLSVESSAIELDDYFNNDIVSGAVLTIKDMLRSEDLRFQSFDNNPCNCKPCDCLKCQKHFKEQHMPCDAKGCFCEICACINSGHSGIGIRSLDRKEVCNCRPCDCVECRKFINYGNLYNSGRKMSGLKPTYQHRKIPISAVCPTDSQKYIDFLLSERDKHGPIKSNTYDIAQNREVKIHTEDDDWINYNRRATNKVDITAKKTPKKNENSKIFDTVTSCATSTTRLLTQINENVSMSESPPKTYDLRSKSSSCNSSGHDSSDYLIRFPRSRVDDIVQTRHNEELTNFFASTYKCNNVPRINNLKPFPDCIEKTASEKNDILKSYDTKCQTDNKCKNFASDGPCSCCSCHQLGAKVSRHNKCPCDCIACGCFGTCLSNDRFVYIRKSEATQTIIKYFRNTDENNITVIAPTMSSNTDIKKHYYLQSRNDDFSRMQTNNVVNFMKDSTSDIHYNLKKVNTRANYINYKGIERSLQEAQEFSHNLVKILEKYEQANRDFDRVTSKYKFVPQAAINNDLSTLTLSRLKEYVKNNIKQDIYDNRKVLNGEKVDCKTDKIIDERKSTEQFAIKYHNNKHNRVSEDINEHNKNIQKSKNVVDKLHENIDYRIRDTRKSVDQVTLLENNESSSSTAPEDSSQLLEPIFVAAAKDSTPDRNKAQNLALNPSKAFHKKPDSKEDLLVPQHDDSSVTCTRSIKSLPVSKDTARFTDLISLTEPESDNKVTLKKIFESLPVTNIKVRNSDISGLTKADSDNKVNSMTEIDNLPVSDKKSKNMYFLNLADASDVTTIPSANPTQIEFQSVQKISDHTIKIKWRTPKDLENILAFELLVNDHTVQLLSRHRKMAIVTCLPHSDQVRITLKTIVMKSVEGEYPPVSYVYHPKAKDCQLLS